jgi:uncharacterized membrane protein YqgA involved in biofilm formation
MKQLILVFATAFSIAGAYVPALFGDTDIFSGWSILGGFIGGIFGIWIGVVVSKRWG